MGKAKVKMTGRDFVDAIVIPSNVTAYENNLPSPMPSYVATVNYGSLVD